MLIPHFLFCIILPAVCAAVKDHNDHNDRLHNDGCDCHSPSAKPNADNTNFRECSGASYWPSAAGASANKWRWSENEEEEEPETVGLRNASKQPEREEAAKEYDEDVQVALHEEDDADSFLSGL